MRKILILLLTAVAALSARAYDFTYNGITYTVIDEEARTVETKRGNKYGAGNNVSGDITIPKTVFDASEIQYTVVGIGDYAFYGCSNLTAIEIPNSVTSIEEYAFYGCSSLTHIEIPNSISWIKTSTFYGCSSLTHIEIPNSVTSIRTSAFRNCSSLTHIEIPNSVTSIGSYAFFGCSNLTSIGNPNSITLIGNYAFYNCESLTDIEIPNSVTSIGNSAFYGCSSLTAIEIPNSVTWIGSSAFSGCSSLTSIGNLDSLTSIDDYTFDGCSSLTAIEIPNSVTSIGKYAFNRCSSLTAIEIPNSVTSIGECAFYRCSGITVIEIPHSVTSIGYSAFCGCSKLSELIFQNGEDVLTLESRSFESCPLEKLYLGRKFASSPTTFSNQSTLKEVTIGNTISEISSTMFKGCTGLKELTLENGEDVLTLDPRSFESCPLEKLYWGRKINASSSPFSGKATLTEVTVGNTIDNISTNLFSGCSGLKNLIIQDGNNSLTCEINAFSSCPLEKLHLGRNINSTRPFSGNTKLTEVTIGNSITSLASHEFYECSGLTSINIPNSVKSIGQNAFNGCSGLTSINIPNSVTSIENSTFYGCSGLTSITIPGSVTNISDYAFNKCSGIKELILEDGDQLLTLGYSQNDKYTNYSVFHSCPLEKLYLGRSFSFEQQFLNQHKSPFYDINTLTEIIISNSISSIGDYTFSGCSRLTSINIPQSVTLIGNSAFSGCSGLTSINIPQSVTSIGNSAFSGCSGLTSINIPNSVTQIEYDVFNGCSGLTSINIPNSVTQIGHRAFSGCSGLTSINIPNSVTQIGNRAFSGCSGLTSINIPQSVTSIDSESFLGCKELEIITVDSDNPNYASVNNILYSKDLSTILVCAPKITGELNIPNSVTSIGNNAFYGCSGITSINIPNSVTQIGYDVFSGCSELKEVIIEDGIESLSIGSFDFSSNFPLEKLYLGRNLSYTYGSPFEYISSLTSLTISESVTMIGDLFKSCTGLKEINLLNPTPPTLTSTSFSNIYDSATLSIPEGTILDYLAANYWKNFISMKVGENETSYINDDIFKYLLIHEDNDKPTAILVSGDYNSFSRASLPERVTDLSNPEQPRRYYLRAIGPSAFKNCKNLTEVTVSSRSSMETISASAFEGCDALKSFGIPATVKKIGSRAFYGCSSLNSITVSDEMCSIGAYAFTNCTNLSEAHLGSGVTEIPTYCFYGCKNLSDFTIGSNVRLIGDYALYNTGIKSISIPASTDSIGYMAFANCPALEEFNLEESTQPICLGNYVNYGSPVKSMYVGRTINGSGGFASCKSLQSLTVGNLVVSLPDNTFRYCESLETLKFGSGLETIGSNAFSTTANKGRLTGVVIPSSVKSIGASAFAGHSMTEVNIGCGVDSIGENAFDGSNVQTVAITAQQPPTAPNNAFSDYSGKLYLQGGQDVLDAYYDAYTCWDRFASYSMVEARRIEGDAVTSITGEPGDKIQLSATVYPSNATLPHIFWKSTNPSIATVDTNGLVTIMQPTDEDMASAGGCKIIASTLYANGPVLEYSVNGSESGIDDCISDQEISGETEVYTINGIRLGNSTEGLAPGIYIVRKGSKVSKIMIR